MIGTRWAALAVAAGVITSYAAAIRPRLVRWGASNEEVSTHFPGDIIEGATRSATMATTINAPPDAVWPWLVQMGTDRAGWYSWDWLDNFGKKSADCLHPEWQDVSIGDRFRGTPDGSQSWEVAALEPGHFLALRMSLDLRGKPFEPRGRRPRAFTDSTWSFLLNELPGGRTRLVVSGYWALHPRWLQPLVSWFILEPSHWVMQTRQFANLKRLAAGGGGSTVEAPKARIALDDAPVPTTG